jgi:SGNH domain (fused to AT3 domains)
MGGGVQRVSGVPAWGGTDPRRADEDRRRARRRALVAVAISSSAAFLALVTPTGSSTLAGASPTEQASNSASVSGSGVVNSGLPVRVLLVGDSTALTLGEGLGEAAVESQYDYVLFDDGIVGCGIADGPEVEAMGERDSVGPACNGATPAPGTSLAQEPWPVQWQHDIAVDHPNVVALLAGRWEVLNREYRGRWTNILHPAFAAYVRRQLELASSLVTSTGARLVFLTAPCTNEGVQPDGAPWPEENPARLAAYNKLLKEVAAEHPQSDTVANLGTAACPGGRYSTGKDGVTIRTVDDGVHFTPEGGVVLAPYVMPQIVAAGRAQAMASGI